MSTPNPILVRTQGDFEIVIERAFAAPRPLVYQAHSDPDLLRRWFTGPEGWSLPTCSLEPKPGGRLLYVFEGPNQLRMTLSGTVLEAVPGERLVLRQAFDPAWFPGDEQVTSVFQDQAQGTLVKTTIRYRFKEARDLVASRPLADGMEVNNRALDALLPSLRG